MEKIEPYEPVITWTGFSGYEGPSINLPLIRVHIKIYQRRNAGCGPTGDELLKQVHQRHYHALPESRMQERVRNAIKTGLGMEIDSRMKLIERKDEDGNIRYYAPDVLG